MPIEKEFPGELEEFFRRLVLEPMGRIIQLIEDKQYEYATMLAMSGTQAFDALNRWITFQNEKYREGLKLAKRGTELFLLAQKVIELRTDGGYKGMRGLTRLKEQVRERTSSDKQASNKRERREKINWEVINRGKLTN